jgi:ribosomal protein S6--L-glutamate ligase
MQRLRGGRRRVALIGNPAGWHLGRLQTALAARGHVATAVRWEALAATVAAGPADAPAAKALPPSPPLERFLPAAVADAELVVVRGMPVGSLEQIVFRMDLLGRLESQGIPIVNPPRGLEIAIDKYLSLARMAAAGLPVPRTIVAQDFAMLRTAWATLGGDCVIKPLFGSRGRGLTRITNEQEAAAVATGGDAAASGGVAYVQEFVPHPGWDVRVLVIGPQAFTIRRHAVAGDWRTNVSLGGRAEPFAAPADWIDLARAAARAVGAEIAGVDLLPASDGRLLVLEVNAVPGWRGLEAATGVPVADRVVDHLETRG